MSTVLKYKPSIYSGCYLGLTSEQCTAKSVSYTHLTSKCTKKEEKKNKDETTDILYPIDQ